MADDRVEVITFWSSPYGLRAVFALAAKGVPFQQHHEEDRNNKSKLLVESNPIYKQIPVLIHNGKPLSESFLIIEYIDETWPSPHGKNLLPADSYDRAMARFWADFVEKKLNGALRTVYQTEGEVQKVAVEEAMGHIATLEGVLEKAPHGGTFFGGDHVGMVDVVLGPLSLLFPAFEVVGDFKFQLKERFPRLHTWSQAMKTSPCAPYFPNPEKLMEFVLNHREKLVLS